MLSISLGCSFAWRKRGTIVEMLPYRYAGGSSRRGKEGAEERTREQRRDEEERLYDAREYIGIGGGVFVLRKLSRDARDEIREKFRTAIRR